MRRLTAGSATESVSAGRLKSEISESVQHIRVGTSESVNPSHHIRVGIIRLGWGPTRPPSPAHPSHDTRAAGPRRCRAVTAPNPSPRQAHTPRATPTSARARTHTHTHTHTHLDGAAEQVSRTPPAVGLAAHIRTHTRARARTHARARARALSHTLSHLARALSHCALAHSTHIAPPPQTPPRRGGIRVPLRQLPRLGAKASE